MGQELSHNNSEILRKLPISAVIFDFDGLLVNTEQVWFETFREVCARYGAVFEETHHQAMVGRGSISALIIEQFALKVEREMFRKEMHETFVRLTENGVAPMPGALELVSQLHARFPLAIGSASNSELIEKALDHLGIRKHFHAIVGGDQVEKGKPAPDIYLEAAQRIGKDPLECLVFEDSFSGLLSAKAAGMRCIAVPNVLLSNADFSSADLIISSLKEVNDDFLAQLEALDVDSSKYNMI